MSNPRGKCVFCGKSGELTKSHVWPEWTEAILPATATHHEQVIGEFATFIPKVGGPPQFQEAKRRVMSERGNRVIRAKNAMASGCGISKKQLCHLFPILLLGRPCLLDTIRQRLLASFLCLVSMRVEFGSRGMRTIPAADRQWLMTRGEPTERMAHLDSVLP